MGTSWYRKQSRQRSQISARIVGLVGRANAEIRELKRLDIHLLGDISLRFASAILSPFFSYLT
jgi:hypothetical protein